MTVLELLNKTAGYFESKGIENSRLEAEILICEALHCKRMDIYSDFEKTVTESEKEILREFLRRRVSGEPLQYITGKQQFRFLELKTQKGVFIPRQETEIIVSLALDFLKGKNEPAVIEVGTGTGAIALSIAKEGSFHVDVTEIDENAVSLAKENAAENGLSEKVKINKGAYFEGFEKNKYDLVVSNPPYIPEGDYESLPEDVKKEPVGALIAPEEGLKIVKELLQKSVALLKDEGCVIIEIATEQGEEVSAFAGNLGFTGKLEKDLTGAIRFYKGIYGNGKSK